MNPAATNPDVTLQINLCAGDLAYARPLVEALVRTHRPDVREVVIVADACRPQSTPGCNAAERFPSADFREKIARLRTQCAEFESGGTVDRVVWLEPDPIALRALNRRYGGIATAWSHDHLGHAYSAYFLGWDCARTRYVAHFDADILLWQQPAHSWIRSAVAALAADEHRLAASPRIAPPPASGDLVDSSNPRSGWSPTWPLEPRESGWHSPWFSTRCHLIDRERLARVLPFPGAAGPAWINTLLAPLYQLPGLTGGAQPALARRLARRIPPFPLPPEVLLHEHAQRRGFSCLYLRDPRAWFIHPDTKPERFLRLLPRLLESVVERGEAPDGQRGQCGIRFDDWEAYVPLRR